MKRIASMFLFFCLVPSVFAVQMPPKLDYDVLRSIPILNNGRYKPLDTFAGETMQTITGKWRWNKQEPVGMLLTILSDHEWMHENIVKIGNMPLKEAMGLDPNLTHFSYETIVKSRNFQSMADSVIQKSRNQQKLTPMDNHVGEVIHQLNLLRSVMDGSELTIVPPPPGSHMDAEWLTPAVAMGYSQEVQQTLAKTFQDLRNAFQRSDNTAFIAASQTLKDQIAPLNPQIYSQIKNINLEIHYNDTRPFLLSWILYLIAFLMFLVWHSLPGKKLYYSALAILLGGFALNTYGMILRSIIADRAPVSNMYETMIWVGWGAVAFGLVYELIYRRTWFLTSASALGVGMLILADIMPFDPNIEPLVPVLRSNYWLVIHVLTITLSYSIFAMAMGLAHVILGVYFYKPHRRDLIKELSLFLYRTIQVGVVFLFVGTVLGGVWAAESWGRFWGWDPKETWALISLLGYLAILHARFTGWLRDFGTAVCSILGFWLILMTWYGVNFVLAVGLHAYGFGSGGGMYVLGYLGLESLFLIGTAYKYKMLYAAGMIPTANTTDPIASPVVTDSDTDVPEATA